MEAQCIKYGNWTSFNKENAPEQAWQNRIFIEHGNCSWVSMANSISINMATAYHGNCIALYKAPTDLVLFMQIRL